MFIDLLRSAHGEKLLRMKAIVKLSDNPERPLILHGVQAIFHPPRRLPAWPEGSEKKTRMVLITKGLEEAFVRDLFDAFTGKPRLDRPDRAAVADNPLAVPACGFKPSDHAVRIEERRGILCRVWSLETSSLCGSTIPHAASVA